MTQDALLEAPKEKRRRDRGGRFELDSYYTPPWATQALLDRVAVSGIVLEPCSGMGSIANVLARSPLVKNVHTNDIDPKVKTCWHMDAAEQGFWDQLPPVDWVVTNPPFSEAARIVPKAHARARIGVAMFLRLSWLEPTQDRGLFLAQNPPSGLIVLPRISFRRNGQVDNVTTAWIVWVKGSDQQSIEVVPNRGQQPALV